MAYGYDGLYTVLIKIFVYTIFAFCIFINCTHLKCSYSNINPIQMIKLHAIPTHYFRVSSDIGRPTPATPTTRCGHSRWVCTIC